jgi:hypothetical protein
MAVGNVQDGGRVRALNGKMYWFVMFNTDTPTVNGNVYDLKSTYVTANLKADLDAEIAQYLIDSAVDPLDDTVFMGNGDVQCFHDYAVSESVDLMYRRGRAPTYSNVVVSTDAAAVFARMNPYLAFHFDPSSMEGKNPGRRSVNNHNGFARANHNCNVGTSGDCMVISDGMTGTTGGHSMADPVASGHAYGGSDRTMLCWLRVINGPVADTQRGLGHVREATITNNCFALSTTATGEFTARYTNGAGTATVATSVTKISELADGLHLIRVTLSQSTLLLSIEIDQVLDGTADATGKANQSNNPGSTFRVGWYNDGADVYLGAKLRIVRMYVTGNLLDLGVDESLPVWSDLYGVQDNLYLTQWSALRSLGVVPSAALMAEKTVDNQGVGNNPAYVPVGPCAGQRYLVSCG